MLFFLFVVGCIEPYEFLITDNTNTLAIEAFISDRSFSETLLYPSDGRYFLVKLALSSDVTNTRSEPVSGAAIRLFSDAGDAWDYTETTSTGAGIYALTDDGFKAEADSQYKLMVSVGEDIYESGWEKLPSVPSSPMGAVGFRETQRQTFVVEAGARAIRTLDEITTTIDLPENTVGEPLYYRWKFIPTWIYKAPLSPGNTAPGYICWASDINYLNRYTLQTDLAGGYKKDIFSIPTYRNERIFEELSVLVMQYSMTPDYYGFWEEMQAQAEGNSLIDQPPFNLATNFRDVGGDKRVSGYFGVVHEEARRWYFNISELTYAVPNTLRDDCLVYYGPPIPGCPVPLPPVACECKHCLDYSFGTTTNIKPAWWGR